MSEKTLAREQIIERIVQYVKLNFAYDHSVELPLDKSLLEMGIIDSYGVIDLVAHCESEFGITIEDDEVTTENLGSILKMADFIVRRLEGDKPA